MSHKCLSLSRFNYASPIYEGHPAMMAGVAARLLGWQRGLTEWNEARHLVDSHPGERQSLWRAVDQDDNVLDILVQKRRNKQAAKKFFRKLLKGLQYVPRVIITDKLK